MNTCPRWTIVVNALVLIVYGYSLDGGVIWPIIGIPIALLIIIGNDHQLRSKLKELSK